MLPTVLRVASVGGVAVLPTKFVGATICYNRLYFCTMRSVNLHYKSFATIFSAVLHHKSHRRTSCERIFDTMPI